MEIAWSIVIPTYNQALPYLEAAIRSAVLQFVDDKPGEVIVVDDGSAIPVEGQLEAVQRDLGRVAAINELCLLRQDNGGVAAALNAGVKAARGEYIQWLSSDDLFRLNKSVRQVKAMKDADAKVCYCAWEEGVPQPKATWPAAQYPSQEALFAVFKQHCFINACCVMWHRSVFDEVGFFNPDIRHCQDYEFLLRCAEKWNYLAVNEPFVRRRIHAGQMLNTLVKPEEAESKRRDMAYLHERYGATAQVWVPETKA